MLDSPKPVLKATIQRAARIQVRTALGHMGTELQISKRYHAVRAYKLQIMQVFIQNSIELLIYVVFSAYNTVLL